MERIGRSTEAAADSASVSTPLALVIIMLVGIVWDVYLVWASPFNPGPGRALYWMTWWLAPTGVALAGLSAVLALHPPVARVAGGVAVAGALWSFRYHPWSKFAAGRSPEGERRATADAAWRRRIVTVVLVAAVLTAAFLMTGPISVQP